MLGVAAASTAWMRVSAQPSASAKLYMSAEEWGDVPQS